jgi:acetyl-CoA acetyltransferase
VSRLGARARRCPRSRLFQRRGHDHSIGATGAVLTTQLIHSMRQDGLTRGVVTLCIGGGQGIVLAIEALH